MLQHGQCWQQEQQTASAPNQIHGQADSHCLVPHKWGEGHWFQIHPSAAGTVGTAMIHGAGTARLESGGVTGMGPAGSRSEDRVLVLGGRLCLWIHQVHSSPGTKAAPVPADQAVQAPQPQAGPTAAEAAALGQGT